MCWIRRTTNGCAKLASTMKISIIPTVLKPTAIILLYREAYITETINQNGDDIPTENGRYGAGY